MTSLSAPPVGFPIHASRPVWAITPPSGQSDFDIGPTTHDNPRNKSKFVFTKENEMRSLTTVIVLLALLAPPALLRADSFDDAEAKRRGVPVEVVQLERAKDRIANLEQQVADLQARIAELQKKMPATASMPTTAPKAATTPKTAPGKTVATKPTVPPEITAAIKDHKLVKGMTVDQAEKAIGVKFSANVSGSEGSVYVGRTFNQTPIGSVGGMQAGGTIYGTEYTLQVDTDGHITSWESRPYTESSGRAGVRP
jgi:hypothetical protein